MICQVCASIDFRPLHEWNRKNEEINNSSNAAFQWLYISKESAEEWERGNGMLQVYYFHHNNPLDLIQSAKSGCHLCAIVAFTLFDDQISLQKEELQLPVAPDINQPIVLMLFLKQGCGSWRNANVDEFIRVFCGPLQGRLDSLNQTISVSDLAADDCLDYCRRLETAWEHGEIQSCLSTWSHSNTRLALSWYEHCKERHHCCRTEFSYLPKRVIDIGEPRSLAEPVLVEPLAQAQADYVTLSHCWGIASKSNDYIFNSRDHDNLKLPSLNIWPQLFRDAIEVTRAFGIRYIWIDAICILQNSQIDWQIESAKMAQYYRNSAFTIAAVSAESNSKRLFGFRNPLLTHPHHLVLSSSLGKTEPPVFERYVCAGSDKIFSTDSEQGPQKSPLHSRGWVLQEELLSTRLLRFGSERIYWQCRGGGRSESMLTNYTNDDDPRIPTMHAWVNTRHSQWTPGRNMVYETWYDMLTRFNARNLTYKNDVLPAISGIAETLQPFLDEHDEYLAGIWKHDLTVGLLWCRGPEDENRAVVSSGQRNYYNENFYAPSWSWISTCHKRLSFKLHPKILTPHGVLLRSHPKTYLTSSIEIEKQNVLAPFGRVKRGVLKFRAQCPQITIFLNREPSIKDPGGVEFRGHGYGLVPICDLEMLPAGFDSHDWYFGTKPGQPFSGECILDRDESEFKYEIDVMETVRSWVTPGWIGDLFGSSKKVLRCVMLPLLHYTTETYRENLPKDRILGLALIPVSESHGDQGAERTYVRIGRVAVNIDSLRWSQCTLPMEEISII